MLPRLGVERRYPLRERHRCRTTERIPETVVDGVVPLLIRLTQADSALVVRDPVKYAMFAVWVMTA